MHFPDDDSQAMPMFFDLLDDDDKEKYNELRKVISNSDKRYKKNKRIESLQEALDLIQKFCIRNDLDNWKRFLVCGVCWMGQDIAINTRQLRLLIDKCKSSINGALSKMGYSTAPIKSSITAALLTYIPYLKGNFVEQRQWTVRRKIQFSPLPPIRGNVIPSYNMYPFQTPEPGTPFIPWNYSPMNSDASTSPETPKEHEIKCIFGVQPAKNDNHSNQTPEKSDTQNQENATATQNNDNSNDMFFDQSNLNENDPNDIFGMSDDKGVTDSEYNFLTDPCCCCPVNWTVEDEECFTMG